MKKALVTGGSAGLGLAMVEALLRRGYDVVSVDRSEAPAGKRVLRIVCDLSDRAAVDAAMPAILAAGPYEVAVLNAGASATGRFEDIPLAACRSLLTLNAETPMLLSAALVRGGALSGHLCLVASLSHFTAYPGAAVYAASKDALAAYAASVRRPFARRGVSVTLACPGPIDTAHAARHAPEGANGSRRMPPARAAEAILRATLRRRRTVVPGLGPKAMAIAARLMPGMAARLMRRLVFERLDGAVW